MTKIKETFLLLLSLVTSITYGQMMVTESLLNPSTTINDASIILHVRGGEPPYRFEWSNKETPRNANEAINLTEGLPYSVRITDKNQNVIERTYTVEAESVTEILNSKMVPAVNFLSKILFFDPFAAFGLYDPVLRVKHKNVPIPNWSPADDAKYKLKKWEKSEGEHVLKGDLLAIIADDKDNEIKVFANTDGIIKHLAQTGEIIYNSNNTEHVIEVGAHHLARIKYDNPEPVLYPNGEFKKRSIPFIVVWLILGAIFFTFRMGFINVRGFKHAIDLAKGKYDQPDAPGKVTHFQALATAVSGTVGLGNIAGVAVAISIGGAGATFWIILAGLLGMSSKFVECTLGVKYRIIKPDGRIFGGPMNYLSLGLARRNMGGFGKKLAIIFAILAVGASFGGGNMFQSNQAYMQLVTQFPSLQGLGFWFGVFSAILVGVVILGGIHSIAKVTEKIVPLMAGIYVLACLTIIFINFQNVGLAFQAIVEGAFSPSALKGGVLGVIMVGFQRAAFSNEAGVGSAAIAHSTAKTNHPPSEGFVSLLEPFIDTVVVCTLTALVLIFTGFHEVKGIEGAALTSAAFESVFPWFPYVLVVAIFLFAFSTMVSWSYYGMRAWTYLFGKSKKSEIIYKAIFLCFVVLGASVSLGAVLDFSDMMILAMSVPNIIGLYILSGEVKADLKTYLRKLKAGELFQNPKKVKLKK